MTDRENVIKRLEICISNQKSGFAWLGCSHDGCTIAGETCVMGLMADALALLKAQVEEIKALRQLVEWAEECGFGLDNILWREYVTEEELDSIDGYVEQMIYVARKAVNGNA